MRLRNVGESGGSQTGWVPASGDRPPTVADGGSSKLASSQAVRRGRQQHVTRSVIPNICEHYSPNWTGGQPDAKRRSFSTCQPASKPPPPALSATTGPSPKCASSTTCPCFS